MTLADRRGKWIRVRMGALCALLAVGLGCVVSAGFTLMVQDGEHWRELAERQRQRRLHIVPKRGTIYDRNGSALAVSVEVPSVSLDAYELLRHVPNEKIPAVARDAAERIARALSIDAASVEKKILRKRRFAWLKRRISRREAEAVRRLGSRELQGERSIAGLRVEGEGHRFYPRRRLLGPTLGFVAPDGQGKDGIELTLDSTLRGHLERLEGLRDRRGRLLFADGIQDEQSLAGHDVELAIDQGIQYVAERELELAIRTFEASGGSVVVVDPTTGELLAMASAPSFNPNDYRHSDPVARRNRALNDVFEPGSTMKMFTVAAGLAAGVIQPTEKLYCEKGSMPVDNVTIRDTHPSEWLPIAQVLSLSSNICSAKIGLSLGEARLYKALRRFGFGQETGVPLPGEVDGTLRPRDRPWVQVETAAASFGQGISVTNLQMAMAAAAIANGGKLMDPILVRKVSTAGGELVREATPRVRRRVLSPRLARLMREMLVGVTEGEGTGTEAAIAGYQVAGKTATAQKTDPRTGQYSLDKYIASFVGMVPAQNPVVAIAVVVDEPMVEHAGGAVAAPVFRRVAEMVLSYRGMTPKGTEQADLRKLAEAPDPAAATYEHWRRLEGKKPPVQTVVPGGPAVGDDVKVPDLTGAPVRHALAQLLELGVTAEVEGSGRLARQEPPPGTVVERGARVKLVFEPAS